MRFRIKLFFLLSTLVLTSSCASIFSKGTYPLVVSTNPDEAEIIINSSDGTEIYKGQSPATVELKASAGFMKKAAYNIIIKKHGYAEQKIPLNYKIDNWYWGNLLLGGVIGMLIIDPATGAMFQPTEDYINVELKVKYDFTNENMASEKSKNQLKIYDIADIPKNLRANMVRIN